MEKNTASSENITIFQWQYDQISNAYHGATERILKFLVLLNTGGLITCVTYFYRSSNPINLRTPIIVFSLGLLFSFLTLAIDYFACLKHLMNFSKNIVGAIPNKTTKPSNLTQACLLIGCGVLSGILGFLGVIIALCKANIL